MKGASGRPFLLATNSCARVEALHRGLREFLCGYGIGKGDRNRASFRGPVYISPYVQPQISKALKALMEPGESEKRQSWFHRLPLRGHHESQIDKRPGELPL
jgi:hypothetical protein